MKRHWRVRDTVVAVLTSWGEWEAVGYADGRLKETVLGKLAHGIQEAPCSAFGPAVPLAVLIPWDVAEMGRLVADMRTECRAGERYHRLIRERFVLGRPVTGKPVERAVAWLVDAWVAERPWLQEKNIA
jgi:hypothetical protein